MEALLTTDEWDALVDAGVLGEGNAVELIAGHPMRKGGGGRYVFSPDQVTQAAELGITLGPSWIDAILERADLCEMMRRRLAGGGHETSYSGRLYVRPVYRGIALEDAEGRPDLEEWIERALRDAGVLSGDEWHSGRVTAPVELRLRIEPPAAP
jgi:hypothetical protein